MGCKDARELPSLPTSSHGDVSNHARGRRCHKGASTTASRPGPPRRHPALWAGHNKAPPLHLWLRLHLSRASTLSRPRTSA
jgi:hypothetical protein